MRATQVTPFLYLKKIVMARFMRATHGNKRDASMGGPDKPGHDGVWLDGKEKTSPGWPAFAGHDSPFVIPTDSNLL
jgi:hypothetical protein